MLFPLPPHGRRRPPERQTKKFTNFIKTEKFTNFTKKGQKIIYYNLPLQEQLCKGFKNKCIGSWLDVFKTESIKNGSKISGSYKCYIP
jgi:hypothetical protein